MTGLTPLQTTFATADDRPLWPPQWRSRWSSSLPTRHSRCCEAKSLMIPTVPPRWTTRMRMTRTTKHTRRCHHHQSRSAKPPTRSSQWRACTADRRTTSSRPQSGMVCRPLPPACCFVTVDGTPRYCTPNGWKTKKPWPKRQARDSSEKWSPLGVVRRPPPLPAAHMVTLARRLYVHMLLDK